MIVHQAYRFALNPIPAQARALSAHCRAARSAFHWGLALAEAVVDQREALTSALAAPRRIWNRSRSAVAPFHHRGIRPEPDGHHVRLPDRGRTGMWEPTREIERADPPPARPRTVVSADPGDGVENLTASGMPGDRRLADAGFRRRLAYKARRRGSRLVVADRWFPSSKTCSGRGVVRTALPPHVRVFRRESCGVEVVRDLNAARNLGALVVKSTQVPERPETWSRKARTDVVPTAGPAPRGLVAGKRPPRTGQPDQTRTWTTGIGVVQAPHRPDMVCR